MTASSSPAVHAIFLKCWGSATSNELAEPRATNAIAFVAQLLAGRGIDDLKSYVHWITGDHDAPTEIWVQVRDAAGTTSVYRIDLVSVGNECGIEEEWIYPTESSGGISLGSPTNGSYTHSKLKYAIDTNLADVAPLGSIISCAVQSAASETSLSVVILLGPPTEIH